MSLDSGESRVGGDLYGMGFQHGAAGAVVDCGSDLRGNVLDQRAPAPDIKGLNALADGENGLVEIKGVLEEELVDGCAVSVGALGLGDGRLAVFLGVDVGGTSGQEDSVAGGEDFRYALGCFV